MDRDNTREIEEAYRNSVADYEKKRNEAIEANSRITMAENENARNLTATEKRIQEFRDEYNSVVANPVCRSCGHELSDVKSQLEKIVEKAGVETTKLNELRKFKSEMKFDVPAQLPYLSLEEKAAKVGIVIDVTTESEKQRKRDYDTAKRDLEDKQKKLKDLEQVKDKETVESIDKAEKEFTAYLETAIAKL